jgi:hypothetical protein
MLNDHLITGQFPGTMHPHFDGKCAGICGRSPTLLETLHWEVSRPRFGNHLFPCRARFYFKYSAIFFGAPSPALCDGFRCILLAQIFKRKPVFI